MGEGHARVSKRHDMQQMQVSCDQRIMGVLKNATADVRLRKLAMFQLELVT